MQVYLVVAAIVCSVSLLLCGDLEITEAGGWQTSPATSQQQPGKDSFEAVILQIIPRLAGCRHSQLELLYFGCVDILIFTLFTSSNASTF